ncbi:MAG: DcrB-related protein [Thermomicrobiales bacterium]
MTLDTRHRTVPTLVRAIARSRGFLAMFLALVTLVALPVLTVGATTTFTDPQSRFSVLFPDGWQQDTAASNPGLIVQYLTMDPNGAFNVAATVMPDGMTIDAVAERVGARLQEQYSDYQQTNSGPASIAGEPGTELDYTATSGDGILLAVSQVLVQHNGTLYFLTLAAKPEDIGAIQTAGAPILLSWQWLP